MRKGADHGYNPQVLTTTSHSHNSFNMDSVAGHESNLGNCFFTLHIIYTPDRGRKGGRERTKRGERKDGGTHGDGGREGELDCDKKGRRWEGESGTRRETGS